MRWRRRTTQHAHRQNPLFTKPNWRLFVIERLSTIAWLTLLIILIAIYLIFYSPLLKINRVEINGLKSISGKTLEEKYINWQLDQTRFKVFPQSNMIMFSRKWLNERITHDYGLASLKINKNLPHTLIITIAEKTPELIWVTDGKNYLLSESGDIVSQITSPDQATGLTYIYDDSNIEVKPGVQAINQEKISFILQLIAKMKQLSQIEVTGYHMPASQSTQVNVLTKAGYAIYFDTSKNFEAQFNKLTRTFDDSAFKENPPKEYIDVRLGDRVYYK